MLFHNCIQKASLKLSLEKDSVMQWHIQAGNITTNIKGKVDFTLPSLSVMNTMTWKCHVYDSAKARYDIRHAQ